MPFPFVLPTTSGFVFASAFACPTHPSLLHTATTYRGVVRDTLKRHKRLPPEAQAANLGLVVASLQDYLPYLCAVVDGLRAAAAAAGGGGDDDDRRSRVRVTRLTTAPLSIEWRPTLVAARLPGAREPPRVRVGSLDDELAFALAALGHAHALQARAALQPLYVVASVVPVGSQQRGAALAAATKSLLAAGAVYALAAAPAAALLAAAAAATPADVCPATLRALAALALAEATLLAVLKDDPYPAAVAQDRNAHDREWMYKSPDLPKVRAHLFARLCLAAAAHAREAAAGARAAAPGGGGGGGGGGSGGPGLSAAFVRYLDDLQHTSRAKACRFFALDAELGGQTGTALAWLQAARQAMGDGDGGGGGGGGNNNDGGSSSTPAEKGRGLLGRLRKDRTEKREDRRVERGAGWGADAGRLEETRVLAMLEAKWTKQNDTINTQRIPPPGPLLAQMPSGRDIHVLQPLPRPALDAGVLDVLRAPLDPMDAEAAAVRAAGGASSSDDEAGGGGGSSGRATAYY